MTEPRPAPYPADTRAKGWRFELDYEQIDQSDTWDLAAELPMCQHALLMMWLVAWRQDPCGSLPADEAVIRAKCKVPLKVWAQCREVLMRGWWLAGDGRLYHDTLTSRVLEMLDYRRKNAERVAKFKAAQREQHGGNALPQRESPSKNDTGTGTTSSPSGKKKRAAKPVAESVSPELLIAEGFDANTAAEFVAHKAAKKAPLTERAWADHCREATKAGMTPQQAAEKVMAKGWKGFDASYVAGRQASAGGADEPAWRTEQRERAAAFAGAAAAKRPSAGGAEIIDMEAGSAVARRVG